jgi:hypothetical protein
LGLARGEFKERGMRMTYCKKLQIHPKISIENSLNKGIVALTLLACLYFASIADVEPIAATPKGAPAAKATQTAPPGVEVKVTQEMLCASIVSSGFSLSSIPPVTGEASSSYKLYMKQHFLVPRRLRIRQSTWKVFNLFWLDA